MRVKMGGFEGVQILHHITSTPQHLVNQIHAITAMCFGNSHTKFGVLLSKHRWIKTVSNLGYRFFE